MEAGFLALLREVLLDIDCPVCPATSAAHTGFEAGRLKQHARFTRNHPAAHHTFNREAHEPKGFTWSVEAHPISYPIKCMMHRSCYVLRVVKILVL